MAAAEASTGKEFALERCPGESESISTEAVSGEEERSMKLCPAKRKAPTAGKNKEDGDSSEEDEEGVQEGIVFSELEEGGSDDDDESMTESEFAAFYEGVRARYRKYWQEEVVPRNWVFKDYSLVTEEGDGNAKVEPAPESK
jgi:hypothetical protein